MSAAQPEEVDEMKKMTKNVGQESNSLKRSAGTQFPIRVMRSVRTINWKIDNPHGLALIRAAVEKFGARKKTQFIHSTFEDGCIKGLWEEDDFSSVKNKYEYECKKFRTN
jgi:hypothetical protein